MTDPPFIGIQPKPGLGKLQNDVKTLYSQTSVFEHNPFQKVVRKAICSKSETIFPIKINANNFNPFQL